MSVSVAQEGRLGFSDQANLLDAPEQGGHIAANNLALTLVPVLANMAYHWNHWQGP